MDLISTCRKLISFDSSPSHGTIEIAKFLKEICKDLDLHGQLFEADENNANFVATFEKDALPARLILQSHLDTVDPGNYSAWTQTDLNPFIATISDGKIYGVGAADVKADLACKLHALSQLKKNGAHYPVAFVGTYGGESLEMRGAKLFVSSSRQKPEYALVGCPSELRMVGSSHGALALDIYLPLSDEEKSYREAQLGEESTSTLSRIFKGKAAHSSTPELGESALLKMVAYLEQLPEQITILNIDGGIGYNTVPGEAFFEIDVNNGSSHHVGRKLVQTIALLDDVQKQWQSKTPHGVETPLTMNLGFARMTEDALQLGLSVRIPYWMDEAAALSEISIFKARLECMPAQVEEHEYLSAFRCQNDGLLTRSCQLALKHLSLEQSFEARWESNESSIFEKHGITCVPFGPGKSYGNSHRPNEFNSIEQMNVAVEFYKHVTTSLL